MRVTVICDVLGSENNGTTIAGMNLIRSLKAKGHEVRVVCPDTFPEDREGFYKVPRRSLGILNNYLEKNCVVLAKPDKAILRAAIEGADVVHLMIPFSLSCAAVPVAEELGVPISAGFHFQAENFTAHLCMMRFDPLNNFVYRTRWKRVYSHVQCIHYPTAFIRDVFEKSIGKSTPGKVISNGVNKAFIENAKNRTGSNGKFTVICTGRYSREKRQELLIKAAALCKNKDDIRLVFAGDGPRKASLKKLAKKLNVDARFEFFSREDLLTALATADLYVHTAEVEIEAIACLEAIASGLVPVIANSPRSATKYYAKDKNNLFDYKDPQSLADMIDFWYGNPDLMDKNRALYADFTKEIDYDICMSKMEQMLFEVAGRKGQI